MEIDWTHRDSTRHTPRPQSCKTLQPPGGGTSYLDRLSYRSIHFYGVALHEPLAEASAYLRRIESETGRPPHVLCVHDEFSEEDDGTDLAWRFTLVISELLPEAN